MFYENLKTNILIRILVFNVQINFKNNSIRIVNPTTIR